MKVSQQSDYETRDVDYSLIHGETKDVFSKFVEALHLKTDSTLLDLGGGYGSVLVSILENDPLLAFNYHLLDSSQLQLKKAKKHINNFLKHNQNNATINYIHQNASKMSLPDNSYDVIVCKMFIHEIPLQKKELVFKKIYSALKPGGQVIFWNPDLNKNDHSFYKNTIRKKDELAKFTTLVKNRHFLLTTELVAHLKTAGFTDIKKLFDFNYDLHTSLRLKAEFHDNDEHLKEWNAYILKIAELLSPQLRKNLVLEVKENNIHIRFKRAVFKALKA